MSNALLTLAMPLAMSSTEKVVLLVLADAARSPDDTDAPSQTWIPMHANEKGPGLVERTCLNERSVQRAIKQLVGAGHISRKQLRHGVIYTVHPSAPATPDSVSGDNVSGDSMSPVGPAPDTLSLSPDTVPPNPLVTLKSPSKASPSSETGARKSDHAQQVFEAWNAMAAGCAARGAEKLTAKRRAAVNAVIREYSLAGVLDAIATVPSKPFLMGENVRGWAADLDWVARPDSITRLREGKYDAKAVPGAVRSGQPANPQLAAAKLEEQAEQLEAIGQHEKAAEARERARQFKVEAGLRKGWTGQYRDPLLNVDPERIGLGAAA